MLEYALWFLVILHEKQKQNTPEISSLPGLPLPSTEAEHITSRQNPQFRNTQYLTYLGCGLPDGILQLAGISYYYHYLDKPLSVSNISFL